MYEIGFISCVEVVPIGKKLLDSFKIRLISVCEKFECRKDLYNSSKGIALAILDSVGILNPCDNNGALRGVPAEVVAEDGSAGWSEGESRFANEFCFRLSSKLAKLVSPFVCSFKRTYTPDVSKYSEVYKNKLGDISTEQKIPEESIPKLSIDTIKMIDVIWFDEEGYPTHAFEVEHTTDITKGLLRLYQTRKLRIKMFIISNQKTKFDKEVSKSPFLKIKDQFIFKNYDELESFFESVKKFKEMKDNFGI